MTDQPAADGLEALRKAFPKAVIGKLPKQGVTLDYVGHAAVTDRLLTVDPTWSWEPLALDEHGLPLYDKAGGLWIKLTICGVTRLGYGDGPDPKQRIGDAIRNAAMRFGVALDLWTKGELESQDPNGGGGDAVRPYDRQPAPPAPAVTDKVWLERWYSRLDSAATGGDLRGLWAEMVGQHKARALSDDDRLAAEQQFAEAKQDLESGDRAVRVNAAAAQAEQVPA